MDLYLSENLKINYEIDGDVGDYLLLIHGNTTSSKIFKPLIKKLRKKYRLILVDLAGHGQSSRLEHFPTNFWEFQAEIVIKLLDHLNINTINILGCSGGGIVALNIALKSPEKINKIIADSIPGETAVPGNIDILLMNRQNGHKSYTRRMFWKLMHGKDWKEIINRDSEMLEDFKEESLRFFPRNLSEISVPVLLTGTIEDELIPLQEKVYKDICAKNRNFTAVLFSRGNHPSMLSNKKQFIKILDEFLSTPVSADTTGIK